MNSLVNFKVKNFRSFYEETIFSMQAIPNKEFAELNTFLCNEKILPKNENELLKSATIFGANASGKTNIVKALDFMRMLVLTSSNPVNPVVQNNTPFAFYTTAEKEPTLFEIEIIYNDVFYDYGFEIVNKQIVNEFLKKRTNVRLTDIFNRSVIGVELNRTNKNKISNISHQSLFVSYANTPFLALEENIIQDLRNVLAWFSESNLIIINENVGNKYKIYQEENGKYAKLALEFIKQADIGIEDFSVEQEKLGDINAPFVQIKGKHPPQMMPIDKEVVGLDLLTKFNVYNKNNEVVDTKDVFLERDYGFHSDGTYRLLSILGLILKTLDKGGVLIIDEIDSKLNFIIVDYIFRAFNSINRNIHNAQLITTAHNVLLMDEDLRRDQIYFASKNKYGATEFYALSDFNDVRKKDLFSKKYLAGFYSAIPNIEGV